MDLWNTTIVALVIVSVIAFSLWARIRATGNKGAAMKVKNPNAPAVKREAEEDWGR
jgi:hypothetical protein